MIMQKDFVWSVEKDHVIYVGIFIMTPVQGPMVKNDD